MNENSTRQISAHPPVPIRPTAAFIGASWAALLLGITAFLVGLYNAGLELNEKGFYFTLLLLGLFSAVSLQKSVRDKLEGVAVTGIYFALCWAALGTSLVLIGAGLSNAPALALSEKGFYGMAFVLSLFAAVAVQKNIRDVARADDEESLPFIAPAVQGPVPGADASEYAVPRPV